jgi:hypothetical protein
MKLTRALRTLALGLMPQPLRYAVIRRGVHLVESELATVESVHIARTVDEYVASMGLVYDGYLKRGLMQPHEARVRMTPYLALPQTVVFVALERGAVSGTVSLVPDGPMGLPMQKIYASEVAAVRAEGRSSPRWARCAWLTPSAAPAYRFCCTRRCGWPRAGCWASTTC